MTRRTFLAASAAASVAGAAPAKSSIGIATTSFSIRRPRDTYEFLELCHTFGAPGIQASLSSLEPAYLNKLKARASELGMYIEVMARLPKTEMGDFVQHVEAAGKVGALCIRAACLSGRRYETFASLEDWKKFVSDSKAALARAVPIAEKYKV
ncbi:MAG: hypothetical protein ACRD7E_11660, partial [Bryobacteraceae bacterium]